MASLRIGLGQDGRPETAIVVLSRRNLLALLHKLDLIGSSSALINGDVEIDGEFAPGFLFLLFPEEDLPHYARRAEPPGQMRPQVEAFIRAQGGWSKTEG